MASTKAAPFGRKPYGAAGRRRAAGPASLSMWLLAVTTPSAPQAAQSARVRRPSNGADDSFTVQRSQSRSYVLATLRALHLDSDLPRQTHWHLSGWTGYSVGLWSTCSHTGYAWLPYGHHRLDLPPHGDGRRLDVGMISVSILASNVVSLNSAAGWAAVAGAVAGVAGVVVSAIQILRPSKETIEGAKSQETLEDRLERLSGSMRESARLVAEVSAELEARETTARRLKEEAETAEALASLHKDQAEAVRKMLDVELSGQARRIRGDAIKIAGASFVAGGGITLLVTLLVHPLG